MVGALEPIDLAPDKAAPKPTTQNKPVKEHLSPSPAQSWNGPLKALQSQRPFRTQTEF